MASKLEIWNMALTNLAAKGRVDSESERTREADLCRNHYDASLQAVFRDHDWAFAHKQVALALMDSEVIDGWEYAYARPNDCAKAKYIVNPAGRNVEQSASNRIPFRTFSRSDGNGVMIATDQADAVLAYTSNSLSIKFYPYDFVIALSWRLAAAIAMGITGKVDIQRAAFSAYGDHLKVAQANDRNESTADPEADGDFLSGRQ